MHVVYPVAFSSLFYILHKLILAISYVLQHNIVLPGTAVIINSLPGMFSWKHMQCLQWESVAYHTTQLNNTRHRTVLTVKSQKELRILAMLFIKAKIGRIFFSSGIWSWAIYINIFARTWDGLWGFFFFYKAASQSKGY